MNLNSRTISGIGAFLLGMALAFLEVGPHLLGGGIAASGLALIAIESSKRK